ncbi:hypothetical protein A5623_26795 [Mycobacterium colombiense]|uniref:DUF4383 domain-containing protein n=2 Tax=Mycobacterium colombiense TaxID=339268 RepID=A0A853LZ62_9MYCO|nr:hypothetical protein A5623_26795 [Mycobacterium colombiense]OBJ60891.1 hypothetical protein A5628_07595 [Mycobacterium colombiense]
MDPGRFHSGRWFLLVEGVLVSAFGIAGLISAALHPHAGPTGAPVLGLATTAAHSAILLAFGVAAIAAIGYRRAAVTVTAVSAIAYLMLLFVSSVATARSKPTLFGFHAADIVLHGVLGIVNLALLMWLIPDELGDEAWGPKRRRSRDRSRPSPFAAVTEPAAGSMSAASATKPGPPSATAPAQESGAAGSPPRHPAAAEQPTQRGPRTVLEQSRGHETDEPSARDVQKVRQPEHSVTRTAVLSHGFVPVAVAVVATVVGIIVWLHRRR